MPEIREDKPISSSAHHELVPGRRRRGRGALSTACLADIAWASRSWVAEDASRDRTVQDFEPTLTASLFSRWPDRVTEVIAFDPERSWLLLEDGGEPLPELADPIPAWSVALPLYAELQIGETAHVGEQLARRVPDLRLESPARFETRHLRPRMLRTLYAAGARDRFARSSSRISCRRGPLALDRFVQALEPASVSSPALLELDAVWHRTDTVQPEGDPGQRNVFLDRGSNRCRTSPGPAAR